MPNCQSKHAVPPPPKSQYELERDARVKRNEAFMLEILGIDPLAGEDDVRGDKESPLYTIGTLWRDGF